ncbi:MAG: VCBS repeat-containing protein [Fidelibacterota bacterium]|nr:MAG: VCBS repeat-containing protein [Candidatus Neomarinimicrobiota bacterium]
MNIVRAISRIGGICFILLFSCSEKPLTIQIDDLFTMLPDDYTHLKFENRLVDEINYNVFKYRNYYNGGGVAIGDVNNDGLPDVYLVANWRPNKLFLNQGDLVFRDVTKQAGVAGIHNWSTGVCLVDINGDRRLDIYVCNSGNIKGDNRANELFVNQGNEKNGVPVFIEAAAEYGIDCQGFSSQAAFFDYDKDGDLDLYVLNNAFRAISTFDLSNNLRHERDPYGGDRLYRNDPPISSEQAPSTRSGRRFVDVSEEAGIYGSVVGFGLGVMVTDINNDQWLDIYVANDFFERDYIYINNHDGTFNEKLEEMVRHISNSSMGGDIADINNDGFMDIYATDMLPEDDYRLKTTFSFETFDFNKKMIEWGYYHQLSQNVLQLNRGFDPQHNMSFSEIGLLAGVAETDWSWGAIIVDLDNDGLKDIFVSNGIFRDVTDQDYLAYLMQEENMRAILRGDRIDFPDLIRKIPSNRLSNYAFRNNGDLTFSNQAEGWGLDIPSFSNGAAYGDLDGDGDNDLVINNVNQQAFVFRNETDSLTDNHYLKVKLVGEGMNPFAVGSRVSLKCADQQIFVLEQLPMRGFRSSVDYVLTFGLGEHDLVDTLIVDWPDGTRGITANVAADQVVTLYQRDAQPYIEKPDRDADPVFRDITETFPLRYRHVENEFVDFHREPLIPHQLSTEGPKIAKGDVNSDGLEDLYIGGSKGFAGKLLVQTASGTFRSTNEQVFQEAKISEDAGVAFFDPDGDGDLDLYVVSGGNEYSRRAPALLDRLYINNGRGVFTQSSSSLPRFYASGSCVAPGDFDSDGDQDLFVGSRSIPWKYGLTPTSYLLENDGEGTYSVITGEYAPGLANTGMVTDAEWIDYDKDGNLDLVVVGEWMPVTLFQNTGDSLVNVTGRVGLEKTNGWWNCVLVDDLNEDGYVDLVVGNLGENSKIQVSQSEPASIYISDFDSNGLIEQILCFYKLGESYPMLLKPDFMNQLPYLNEKYPKHADYAAKRVTEIFTEEQVNKAVVKKAYTFATTLFCGNEDGTFLKQPLPAEAQFSPVYAIIAGDFDSDGSKDLLLAGNFYGIKPQLGRYDASYGTLLRGNGAGGFASVPMWNSGLSLTSQVRDMVSLTYRNKQEVIIIAKNNDRIQVYEIMTFHNAEF